VTSVLTAATEPAAAVAATADDAALPHDGGHAYHQPAGGTSLSCEVTDVYGKGGGASAASLGRFAGSYTDDAVPPHGTMLCYPSLTTVLDRTLP
jgi:hypothetical protein